MTNDSNKFAEELKVLADRLDRCQQVNRFDTATEKQAWTLAHSLLDLAQSFKAFQDDLLPRLRDERLNCDEMADLLLEIGEELRHVIYHSQDPEFFAYLRPPATPPTE